MGPGCRGPFSFVADLGSHVCSEEAGRFGDPRAYSYLELVA